MQALRILSACLLFSAAPLSAQTVDSTQDTFAVSQGAAVPEYVVPVLRLVSSTHVEPTTGLVLSSSGLVLVPAGFASQGDEIVVLDGGTDIVSNGRKARIERNFPMDGLQVLEVYGLQRQPAPFANGEPGDGDAVRLNAFPPAERIAEGAPPLDNEATLTVFGRNPRPAVSGGTPLPNVTGPLLDSCGNVVAFSIANGVQTMETSPGTRYQWRETILGIIEALGLEPGPTACIEIATIDEPEVLVENEPAKQPLSDETPAPAEEADSETAETEPTTDQTESEGAEESLPDVLPPMEEPGQAGETIVESEPDSSSGGWAWLIAALVLIAAGIGLHRYRGKPQERNDEAGPALSPPPITESGGEPQSSLDSVMILRGHYSDGREFEVSCPVSRDAVNVVIGRGGADLRIESPAISRRHASLSGTGDGLTVTDLGSNNGTRINGVPCLEGEIMYVEPGDTLAMGDAWFTIEIVPAGDGE